MIEQGNRIPRVIYQKGRDKRLPVEIEQNILRIRSNNLIGITNTTTMGMLVTSSLSTTVRTCSRSLTEFNPSMVRPKLICFATCLSTLLAASILI
jgi:hypothetical protein